MKLITYYQNILIYMNFCFLCLIKYENYIILGRSLYDLSCVQSLSILCSYGKIRIRQDTNFRMKFAF